MSDSRRWTYPKSRRRARMMTAVAAALALTLAGALAALACSPSPAPAPTATPVPPTPTRTPIPDEPPAFPFPTVVVPTPAAVAPPSAPAVPPGAAAPRDEDGLGLPSIADLVESVETAVASISVESVNRGAFYDFTDEGAGTGVIVRPDGYIVTNYHVIQDVVGVKAHLPNGESYDAEIVGWDVISDLAVIKIETDEELPVAAW